MTFFLSLQSPHFLHFPHFLHYRTSALKHFFHLPKGSARNDSFSIF